MPVYNWRAVHSSTIIGAVSNGLAATEIEAMELAETAMTNPAASLATVQPLELNGEHLRPSGPALIGLRTLSGQVKWATKTGAWLTTAEFRRLCG